MGLGMDLLFGGELEQVVDPRNRPAPVPRPQPYGASPRRPQRRQRPPQVIDGTSQRVDERPVETPPQPTQQALPQFAPPSQPAPEVPAQPQKRISGVELLLGGDQQPEQPPANQAQESNTGSWIAGAYNYMTGADRDPQYKDVGDFDTRELLPANATDDSQFAPYRAARRSMLFGATDAQLGDVIELQLGDRLIRRFKDKNGADLVEYVGNDGQKKVSYINQPGANLDDVGRFAEGAIPYLTAARVASGLGGGFGAQSVVQGAAAGGTSLAGDAVNTGAGSQQGIDPFKALITAGFATGAQLTAPAVGFLWRRLVKEPQLFNAQTGTLTQKGAQAAKEAGLEPGQLNRVLARQFARDLAKTNNSKEAGMRIISDSEFGVPTTRGQRTKSIPQLTDEGVIAYGGYGDDAASAYKSFIENQSQALDDAAIGQGVYQSGFQPNKASVAKTIAPEYARPGGAPKRELGQDIAEGVRASHAAAKAEEKLAWEGVKDIVPTLDALKTIPSIIDEAKYVTGIAADDIGTPTALRMIDRLDDFMQGTVNQQTGLRGRASEVPKSVDGVRRQLGQILSDAQTPTDKKLAGAIYERYNNWISRMAEQQLLSGNPNDAARLFGAVDISRTLNQVYKPKGNASQNAAGKMMAKILDDAVTPEKLVDDLFGASFKGPAKAGVTETLKSIKQGLTRLGDDEATRTWNAIRMAYWQRIVKAKAGDVVGPQAMQTNLKTAFEQQGSIISQLYTQQERAQMRRFLQMLDGVVAPRVNSSGSGFVGVSQARRGLSQFVEKFTGKFIADLFDRSLGGIIKSAQGSSAVSRAISQEPTNAMLPTLGGFGGAVGAGIERQPRLSRNSQRIPAR